jgi:hypothetical protein
MSDGSDLLPWLAGPGSVIAWKLGEWLVGSKVKRGEQAEEKAEDERDNKLGEVLEIVTKMERELAVMGHKLTSQAVESGEIKARVEGMSANYGSRVGLLEQRLAVLDEGMRELRERRRR